MKTDPSAEKITFSRPPDLPGVEVLRAQNCTHLFSVLHTAYEVCTILPRPTQCKWVYRGKSHITRSRGTSFMEPGEIHHNPEKVQSPSDFRVLIISAELMRQYALENGSRESPHYNLAQSFHPGFYRKFMRLHSSLEGIATPLERQSLFAECIRTLLERCMEHRPALVNPHSEHEAVRRAREFIHEHHSQSIPLEQLARIAGLSRFHLIRAFAKQMGVPPHTYQLRIRIAKARHLLARRIPPAQVALELGFYDQSHFSEHFKRTLGVTPGEYNGHVGPSLRVPGF